MNWVGLAKPYKGRFIFVSKRFKRRCRLTQFVVLKIKLSATPAAWPVFLITTIVLCGVLVSAAVDVSHILIWWLAADDNKHCVIQTLASASSACCCAVSLATKIAVCSACLRCKVLSVWRNCCVFCVHESQNIYKRNDFTHNHWNRGRTLDTEDDNLYSGYQHIYPLSHWVLLSTSPGLNCSMKSVIHPLNNWGQGHHWTPLSDHMYFSLDLCASWVNMMLEMFLLYFGYFSQYFRQWIKRTCLPYPDQFPAVSSLLPGWILSQTILSFVPKLCSAQIQVVLFCSPGSLEFYFQILKLSMPWFRCDLHLKVLCEEC